MRLRLDAGGMRCYLICVTTSTECVPAGARNSPMTTIEKLIRRNLPGKKYRSLRAKVRKALPLGPKAVVELTVFTGMDKETVDRMIPIIDRVPVRVIGDETLGKYKHASPEGYGNLLAFRIEEVEEKGLRVIDAKSARRTVPNSYGIAAKMKAPSYFFNISERTVELWPMKLEHRPFGTRIPGHIVVKGSVPAFEGFRCLKRTEEFTEFIY